MPLGARSTGSFLSDACRRGHHAVEVCLHFRRYASVQHVLHGHRLVRLEGHVRLLPGLPKTIL